MGYDAAIFDMDGTILDTLDDLAASTNATLAAFGMPTRSTDEVRRFVGNGIRRLISRAVPAGTDETTQDRVFDAFCTYYAEHDAMATAPYPGIPELLASLRDRGVALAVVSNKGDFAVQSLVRRYFPDAFGFAVGERDGIRRKPAPDSVFAALEALGVNADRAVYVGDSEVDIQTAQAAGLPCISCAWGFRSVDTLMAAGARCLVHTTDELAHAILDPTAIHPGGCEK